MNSKNNIDERQLLIERIQQLELANRKERKDKGRKHNYPKERKERSDKGVEHNYPTERQSSRLPRTDLNQRHSYVISTENDKIRMYRSLRNRLLSQGVEPELDDNGYYIVIDEQYDAHYGNFANNSNVKYTRSSREHDIERYRFEAWQLLAITSPNNLAYEDERLHNDLVKWAYHCTGMTRDEIDDYFNKRNLTIVQLFCEFYHVSIEDITIWTYDEWREYYECTPRLELDRDFTFIYGMRPGTSQFHPEWSYIDELNQKNKEQEYLDKKSKNSWSNKISKN